MKDRKHAGAILIGGSSRSRFWLLDKSCSCWYLCFKISHPSTKPKFVLILCPRIVQWMPKDFYSFISSVKKAAWNMSCLIIVLAYLYFWALNLTRSWYSWESKKIRKYFNESQKISIPSSVAQRVIQTRGPGLKILFVFRNQSFSIRVCSFSNECKYYYWRHMATHMDFPTSRQDLSGVHMAEHDLRHGNFN